MQHQQIKKQKPFIDAEEEVNVAISNICNMRDGKVFGFATKIIQEPLDETEDFYIPRSVIQAMSLDQANVGDRFRAKVGKPPYDDSKGRIVLSLQKLFLDSDEVVEDNDLDRGHGFDESLMTPWVVTVPSLLQFMFIRGDQVDGEGLIKRIDFEKLCMEHGKKASATGPAIRKLKQAGLIGYDDDYVWLA